MSKAHRRAKKRAARQRREVIRNAKRARGRVRMWQMPQVLKDAIAAYREAEMLPHIVTWAPLVAVDPGRAAGVAVFVRGKLRFTSRS